MTNMKILSVKKGEVVVAEAERVVDLVLEGEKLEAHLEEETVLEVAIRNVALMPITFLIPKNLSPVSFVAPNTKLVQACRESHQVFLSWRGKLKMNLAPQPVLLVGDL